MRYPRDLLCNMEDGLAGAKASMSTSSTPERRRWFLWNGVLAQAQKIPLVAAKGIHEDLVT